MCGCAGHFCGVRQSGAGHSVAGVCSPGAGGSPGGPWAQPALCAALRPHCSLSGTLQFFWHPQVRERRYVWLIMPVNTAQVQSALASPAMLPSLSPLEQCGALQSFSQSNAVGGERIPRLHLVLIWKALETVPAEWVTRGIMRSSKVALYPGALRAPLVSAGDESAARSGLGRPAGGRAGLRGRACGAPGMVPGMDADGGHAGHRPPVPDAGRRLPEPAGECVGPSQLGLSCTVRCGQTSSLGHRYIGQVPVQLALHEII